jgi:hypothetical protein
MLGMHSCAYEDELPRPDDSERWAIRPPIPLAGPPLALLERLLDSGAVVTVTVSKPANRQAPPRAARRAGCAS